MDLFNQQEKTPQQFMDTFLSTGIMPPIDSTTLTKAYIAIDPGKHGGIVIMTTDGKVISKHETPLLNDDLDVLKLSEIISEASKQFILTAIVEDVHSIFGTSSGSNFTFGYVCGQIDAVVRCNRLKLINIQPKFWQKNAWTTVDMVYKPKKPDQKKASVDTKATSLNTVKRLFPNEDCRGNIIEKYYADNAKNRKLGIAGKLVPTAKTKEHDGIVDALLMAEVARRLNY